MTVTPAAITHHSSAPDRRDAESAALWAPLQTETLSARIVAQVRAALFSGQLRSGDLLGSEATLSERFGVSRTAARDALRTLEALGIVEIRMGQKGGAWIAAGNPARFADTLAIQLQLIGVRPEEVFDAQIAIESQAAELAARNRTEGDLARLREILEELRRQRDDPVAFPEAAVRFHQAVVEASQNRILLAQFKALSLVLHATLSRAINPGRQSRAIASHTALLGAIEGGEESKAQRIMYERLQVLRARYLANAPVPQAASQSAA